MAHLAIIPIKCSFVVYSWTTGVVNVKVPRRIRTDDDALAYAMYLHRHGRTEEAEVFLDNYCT